MTDLEKFKTLLDGFGLLYEEFTYHSTITVKVRPTNHLNAEYDPTVDFDLDGSFQDWLG